MVGDTDLIMSSGVGRCVTITGVGRTRNLEGLVGKEGGEWLSAGRGKKTPSEGGEPPFRFSFPLKITRFEF